MPTLIQIGLMVAMIIFAGSAARFLFGTKQSVKLKAAAEPERLELEKEKIRAKDRADTREMLERLAVKKLDVIKDAIAMGYDDLQLAKLDERLENLVGAEKLTQILNPGQDGPQVDSDLLDADLHAEIERFKRRRERQ